MRFQEFMERVIVALEKRKYASTVDLSHNIRGGWEVWFQVEVYFQLVETTGVESFDREIQYPHSTKKADFCFVPKNATSTKTWIELKVQNRDDSQDAVKRFGTDIVKIQDVVVPTSDTVGAIVIIPTGDYKATLKWAKTYVKEALDLSPSDISCYLVNDTDVSKKFALSASTYPSLDAPALVMSYAKL